MLLVTVLLSFCGPAVASGKRVALVIGNSQYWHVSNLPNPANDAEDLSAALERIGFEVTRGQDLDYREMRLTLRDFAEVTEGAEMVVVYFAGHGIEIDNTNYLIPVNAELRSDRDVEFEAIRLDAIVNAVADVQGLKVILIDACRNNPFLADMTRTSATRSIGRGLGRIDPGGVLVGYAARGGTLALDGEGRNSPYAEALLSHIEEPGLELGKMFRKVRDTVFDLTDGYQEPFTYGSLPGQDIFLVPAAVPSTNGASTTNIEMLRIAEAFVAAQADNTEEAWSSFLESFETTEENPLVVAARRSLLALKDTGAAKPVRRGSWLAARYDANGRAELDKDQRILVQKALNYAGHDVGPPDGTIGPRTRAAVASARLAYGLNPGDRIDRALLDRLPDAKSMETMFRDTAQRFDPTDLPAGIEPRLERALKALDASVVRFGYHAGHLYIAVLAKGGFWQNAANAAQRAGGHLVTLGDAEENRFVYELFSSDPRFLSWHQLSEGVGQWEGPMIGLYQIPGSSEPSVGWAWVTGEPATYTPWHPGQPNNSGSNANYARYISFARSRDSRPPAIRWDDTSTYLRNSGFIIEIE